MDMSAAVLGGETADTGLPSSASWDNGTIASTLVAPYSSVARCSNTHLRYDSEGCIHYQYPAGLLSG